MLKNKMQNLIFAARKLHQMGVPFPIDKNDAMFDIIQTVKHQVDVVRVTVDDSSYYVITLSDIFDHEFINDAVYAVQFEFNLPVIGKTAMGDYVVFDADPLNEEDFSVWPR